MEERELTKRYNFITGSSNDLIVLLVGTNAAKFDLEWLRKFFNLLRTEVNLPLLPSEKAK